VKLSELIATLQGLQTEGGDVECIALGHPGEQGSEINDHNVGLWWEDGKLTVRFVW